MKTKLFFVSVLRVVLFLALFMPSIGSASARKITAGDRRLRPTRASAARLIQSGRAIVDDRADAPTWRDRKRKRRSLVTDHEQTEDDIELWLSEHNAVRMEEGAANMQKVVG